eukprot:gene57529-biopygen28515
MRMQTRNGFPDRPNFLTNWCSHDCGSCSQPNDIAVRPRKCWRQHVPGFESPICSAPTDCTNFALGDTCNPGDCNIYGRCNANDGYGWCDGRDRCATTSPFVTGDNAANLRVLSNLQRPNGSSNCTPDSTPDCKPDCAHCSSNSQPNWCSHSHPECHADGIPNNCANEDTQNNCADEGTWNDCADQGTPNNCADEGTRNDCADQGTPNNCADEGTPKADGGAHFFTNDEGAVTITDIITYQCVPSSSLCISGVAHCLIGFRTCVHQCLLHGLQQCGSYQVTHEVTLAVAVEVTDDQGTFEVAHRVAHIGADIGQT